MTVAAFGDAELTLGKRKEDAHGHFIVPLHLGFQQRQNVATEETLRFKAKEIDNEEHLH